LGVLPFTGGTMRLSWTNSAANNSFDIYGWDEESTDRADVAVPLSITAARVAGTATVTVASGAEDNVAGDDAFIRSSAGVIKWFGTIATIPGDTSLTVSDDEGATWATGDKLVAGVIHQHIQTNRLRFGDLSYDNLVTGVTIRADITASYAYAKVSVTNEDGGESLFTARWGDRLRDGTTRFRQGQARGTDIVLDIWIVSDGRVNVKDIALEVQGGDR